MLHIVWLILKIIGIVLLTVLGLILLILLLVLLVPVRYRAEGSRYQEVLCGSAGLSWLLHIFSLRADYREELQITFRIFGIRIQSRENADEEGAFEEPLQENDDADAGEPVSAQSFPEAEEPEALETESPEESSREPSSEELPDVPPKKRKPRKKRPPLLKRFFEKVRFSFKKICDTLKHIGEKKAQLKEAWEDEENRDMVSLILKQLKRLLRHIRPVKLKGSLKFGFDDPSQTGQVLMYISPFYGLYGRNLTICPCFEEKILEGELKLKGRIRVGTLLMIVFALIRNRRFRTLAKRFMK